MTRNTIIVIVAVVLTAAITLVPTCYMLWHQRAEIERAQAETEAMRAEIERVTAEIDAATKRLDAAVQHYTKGIEDAHKAHEDRMAALPEMAPEAQDWLCEPVPDDVCLLFDEYTLPGAAHNSGSAD